MRVLSITVLAAITTALTTSASACTFSGDSSSYAFHTHGSATAPAISYSPGWPTTPQVNLGTYYIYSTCTGNDNGSINYSASDSSNKLVIKNVDTGYEISGVCAAFWKNGADGHDYIMSYNQLTCRLSGHAAVADTSNSVVDCENHRNKGGVDRIGTNSNAFVHECLGLPDGTNYLFVEQANSVTNCPHDTV